MPVEYSQITTQMQTHVSQETFAKLWQNDEPPHTLEAVELFSNNNNMHTHIYMSIMYQGQLNDLNGIANVKNMFFFQSFYLFPFGGKTPQMGDVIAFMYSLSDLLGIAKSACLTIRFVLYFFFVQSMLIVLRNVILFINLSQFHHFMWCY